MPILRFPQAVRALLIAFALGSAGELFAQELQTQAAPFTSWLDFKALANPDAPRPALPIWMESVQVVAAEKSNPESKTTFRIRLRNFPGLNDEIMLRVYFMDEAGAQPVVTRWTELGSEVGEPKILGSGLGLSTNETILVSTAGVDYIDIEASGDGSSIRGALLCSLKNSLTKQATDFDPPKALTDPFEADAPTAPSKNDTLLFGRVKATLDDSTIKISGTNSNVCAYEFELDHQPLVAVISFELLNADPSSPPLMSVNNTPLGAVSQSLPDLADPAYWGTVRPVHSDMQFHYNGWIKCQKIIPGSCLTVGLNKAALQAVSDANGFAIRSVEIQLKYTAQTLDYDLKP